jgi:chromosome segregation ATPase
MKKSIITAILTSFAFLFVLFAFDTANAQAPTWARRQNRNNVNATIRRLENQTDRFRRQLEQALNDRRLGNWRRESNVEARADELESATDELRREFDRRTDSWWETRNNVSRVVSAARNLNSLMRDRRLNNLTRNSWANVQREVNSLARLYGLPRV